MNALRKRLWGVAAYLRSNPKLLGGVSIILALVLFWLIGSLLLGPARAGPLTGLPSQPPSWQYLLGTDTHGRDLLAVMIAGAGFTLRIGFLAGIISLGIGMILGFLSGYYGGLVDTVIKGTADVLLTMPALAILVVVAAMIPGEMSLDVMILIVASLSWMLPTRAIRAQVLTMRERAYIQVARLSGMNSLEVIVKELMPNLLPYLAASFVAATAGAVLALVGLEALGLGPQSIPTLGMTIYWAIAYAAIIRGMWWWWAPPAVIIAALFVGLFLLTAGLDEIANPRLRRRR